MFPRRVAIILQLVLVGASCTGGAPRPSPSSHNPTPVTSSTSAPGVATEWLTFGGNVQRWGYNGAESALTPATVPNLRRLWTAHLGGAITSTVVMVSHVQVVGRWVDLLVLGSGDGGVYGVDASTGAVVWRRHLGTVATRCPFMPGERFGVSGTPAIDRATGRVYVVSGKGRLYALDLFTGAVVSGWPVRITPHPDREQIFGAVTLWQDRVYLGVASNACDFPPFHGRVVAVDARNPRVIGTWYSIGRSGPSGGGIWGPAGVAVDPADGAVYTATGNALAESQHSGYAENVVRLTPSLEVSAANYPGSLEGLDVDFGTTPLLYDVPGCPPMLAAENKSGVLLVYRRDAIGNGPVQRLQVATPEQGKLLGIPAFSPATKMLYVASPADSDRAEYRHGLVALRVGTDCRLALAWQATVGPNFTADSPPTVAGNVVYFSPSFSNRVFAFDATTGDMLWDSGHAIRSPVTAAPTVLNGRLYVGSWGGRLFAFGL
jgi:outer membrane protein assembly factor BamB